MEKYQYSSAEMALMEQSSIPFAIYQFINKRVVTLVLSQGFLNLFGLERDEAYPLMDNDMYRDTHPDDVARAANAAYRFATEDKEFNVAYRSKVNGSYRIIHARGEHIYPRPDVKLAVVWYINEGDYAPNAIEHESVLNQVFNKVLLEETMEHKSFYDNLTGLPNMTGFLEMAGAKRSDMWKYNIQPKIIFFNINGMKYYNRRYGYNEGSNILRRVANILKAHYGNDNYGRFGMDIFAVLTGEENPEKTLSQVFEECGRIENGNGLTLRAGIAIDVDEKMNFSLICDRAKYACDVNRGTLVSKYSYFNDSMLANLDKRQYIIDNLDRAIQEKWIRVYYHPIVRTANGKVCDEEALARWIDPVRGFLVPADFIQPLEESKLIYKLDLYMVEQVLEKIKLQASKGLHVVPISINFSRTDFDVCDLVEEVRKRVDASGISRDKITIEITESVVGTDFDFIKAQVKRFQSLGFKVWMDDFGSGYSSLDVLQSIRFDLIKFDMKFMQRFGEGDEAKIILTELMKMSIGLELETLCEGVERQEQLDFLREIGCTKVQGFYYTKPIPMEEILNRYDKGIQIGFENPAESDYYSALGRINLYDMAVVARDDQESFRNYFNTLPITIIESNGEKFRIARCNQSFRDFANMMGWNAPAGKFFNYADIKDRPGLFFMNIVRQCGEDGSRTIIDDVMPNGSIAHAFLRKIAANPVTGMSAIVIAVLGVMDNPKSDSAVTYARIAQALSSDYFNLFYVNLKTEQFVQYDSDGPTGNIAIERHGENFFSECLEDAPHILYEPDLEMFINAFTKEKVIQALKEREAYTLTYRQMYRGKPVYVNMKVVRMTGESDYVIIGISNIDAQMKQRDALERARQERLMYNRITALSGDMLCIYVVDPETNSYSEYSAANDYTALGLAKQGEDFFNQARKSAPGVIYEPDMDRFLSLFSKEKIMNGIRENKVYGIRYRLMINGEPKYVSLKAALMDEPEGQQLIIGVQNIDARLKRDHAYAQNIAIANAKVNIDSLTGVKSKHAYEAVTEQLDEQINNRNVVEFAIVVFGMKGLLQMKTGNTREEEENRIKKAANVIGSTFKRSPLFRFDKDEFVVISQGQDYDFMDDLVRQIEQYNDKNAFVEELLIPVGMAKYAGDRDVASVYNRAVEDMKSKYMYQ
ncbi:MAG: EAL domain-containing protein [Anaerolineaceae bacterium]|nr:EAL domain-containing protein [Anaerolineaceae bacterium]